VAGWSFLLGAGLAGAEPAVGQGLFPPQCTVVLVAGVPGDVESEENYRDQMQDWVELARGSLHGDISAQGDHEPRRTNGPLSLALSPAAGERGIPAAQGRRFMGGGQAARIFVLCDDPQDYRAETTDHRPQTTDPKTLGVTNGLGGTEAIANSQSPIANGRGTVSVLKGDRENF